MEYVLGAPADQGQPTNYSASDKQFATTNALLYYLTATNKSGSSVAIQLYDVSASAAAELSAAVPRELICPASSTVGWMSYKMFNGIYVRAASALGATGALSAVGAATGSVKFDCGYMSPWPAAS